MSEGIASAKDFKDTPNGWAERWTTEFAAAEPEFKRFWEQSEKVVKRFLDKRDGADDSTLKLNLFHSNVTTLRSMLYGRIPKIEVYRRYADSNDDVARVAGVILQRVLSADIEEAGEDYSAVMRSCLDDRLLTGLGTARLKYEFEEEEFVQPPIFDEMTGQELAPEVRENKITDEWVDTIYTHWRDVMWSPCRTWDELRWMAFRAFMTKDEYTKRFGDEFVKEVPVTKHGPVKEMTEEGKDDAWDRIEVWEIWCKDKKEVHWFIKGFDKVVDRKKDPLGLTGFWPAPPPMLANVTTSLLMPRSDFVIAQDLYNEIDILSTRISLLTKACKVVGVYDKASEGIQRMLNEGVENELIPVDNWAAFAEKGGLKGQVDWLPIEAIVAAIDKLTQKRDEAINLLYQVTGMSDILRGASLAGASATEQAIKARFASVRVQALQDEFARLATDIQRIKAEIVSKHFQPETIVKASNIMTTTDAQMAEQAIGMLKDREATAFRINIRPETLAMVDYAQLKQDRTEYINALGLFLQSASPIIEFAPESTSILLELLKWGLAGFKGSNEIEGVLDQAISQLQQNPPQKPKDGEEKAQMEQQKHQMKMQQESEKHQMQMKKMMADWQMDMKKMMMEFQMEYQKLTQKSWFDQQDSDRRIREKSFDAVVKRDSNGAA
jgi:hypothetical protein